MIKNHQYYMAKAIQLAKKGRYSTHPNPQVGCILVKDQQIIGQGFHEQAGKPHAEREAIKNALEQGNNIQGATAYVTLEPCCHQGRTPPCTHALIEQQVQQVIIGMRDPNPLVAGKGIELLKQQGISVESGIMQTECEALNRGFIKRMKTQMPWVCCKLAMSLDGRTAMQSGESKWISGAEARQDVQKRRAQSSAIVTGIGTVLTDNPSMNVRMDNCQRQPLRVILDSQLQTPPNAKILTLDGQVLIFCHQTAFNGKNKATLTAMGAEIKAVQTDQHNRLDLTAIFKQLALEYEINEVLLETGATLAGNALEHQLIDEMVIYIAPHIMGDQARGLFHLPALNQMHDRMALKFIDIRFIGENIRLTARPLTSD